MIRVKLPYGLANVKQLETFAEVAEKWAGSGVGHVTTRQNIQLHFVKEADAEKALSLMAEVGLTTREACGNAVRNITGCPFAGVAAARALRRVARTPTRSRATSCAGRSPRRCRASSRSPSAAAAASTTSRRRSTTSAS